MKNLFMAFVACIMAFNLSAQDGAIRVKVVDKGSLVFLHGFACPGEEWDETVHELKEKFECHIITYAGFGGVASVDIPWMKNAAHLYICIAKAFLYKTTMNVFKKNTAIEFHSMAVFVILILYQPKKTIAKQK
jgi:hypothetical protein